PGVHPQRRANARDQREPQLRRGVPGVPRRRLTTALSRFRREVMFVGRNESVASRGRKRVIDLRMPISRLVVSKDGTGDFTSIAAALQAATPGTEIFVRYGFYEEQ